MVWKKSLVTKSRNFFQFYNQAKPTTGCELVSHDNYLKLPIFNGTYLVDKQWLGNWWNFLWPINSLLLSCR